MPPSHGHLQRQCTLSTSTHEASPTCSTAPTLGMPTRNRQGPVHRQFRAQGKKLAWLPIRRVGPCSQSGAWLTPAKAVGDAQAERAGECTMPHPSRGSSVNRVTEGVEHWRTSVPLEAQFSRSRQSFMSFLSQDHSTRSS